MACKRPWQAFRARHGEQAFTKSSLLIAFSMNGAVCILAASESGFGFEGVSPRNLRHPVVSKAPA